MVHFLIEQNLGLFSKFTFLLEICIRALGPFWFFSTQFIATFPGSLVVLGVRIALLISVTAGYVHQRFLLALTCPTKLSVAESLRKVAVP
jgi:hypothetical protein